jgi:hypothetical protein
MSPTTQVIISKLAFEMRLVVIVILSSFLLGNSFFKELFRINILIHHYQEHKQVDPEISFFKFYRSIILIKLIMLMINTTTIRTFLLKQKTVTV